MRVRKQLIFLFLAPTTLVYLVFFLLPTLWAFYYSMFNWSGFTPDMTFIGFKNYADLLTDKLFWLSLTNTLKILFLGGIIVFPLAFVMTILINADIRGKKFFRAMIFLPNVIATIAITTMWAFIYNPRFGLLNGFFKIIGLTQWSKILWMSSEHVFSSMMIAIIWIYVGFLLVLLKAGIDKIPYELNEAAKIEGANSFQLFFYVTLPMIWDVISVAIVLWSIFAIKVFEFPYAFNGIEPNREIYTVGIYLYIMGFGKRDPIYRLGYATAIGVILLICVIIIVLLLRRILRRDALQY
jgi:ABC-type sugar transport system permease subunit